MTALACLVLAAANFAVTDPTVDDVKLVRVYEDRYANSFELTTHNNQPAIKQLVGRHTLTLVFKRKESGGFGSYDGPLQMPHSSSVYVADPDGYVGEAPAPTSDMYIGVVATTGGMSAKDDTAPSLQQIYLKDSPTSPVYDELGIVHAIAPGEKVRINLQSADNDTLVPEEVDIVIWTKLEGQDPVTEDDIWLMNHRRIKIDTDKLFLKDAAIDTRKMHGQPNAEGVWPGDPNAEPHLINFGPWHWRGGLFIGHMPKLSMDRSGTARTQFWPINALPDEEDTDLRILTLTLMDWGSPPGVTSEVSLSMMRVNTTNGSFTDPENQVTWATRWTSGAQVLVPYIFNTSTPAGNYANWQITTVSSGGVYQTPDTENLKFFMQLTDETNIMADPNQTYSGWRYFMSREHQAQNPTVFPAKDAAPRIWSTEETFKLDYLLSGPRL